MTNEDRTAILDLIEDLRHYTHDWDWKYGAEWDAEILRARKILDALREPIDNPDGKGGTVTRETLKQKLDELIALAATTEWSGGRDERALYVCRDAILTAATAPGEGLREAIQAFSDELDYWTNARPVPPVEYMTMQCGPEMVAAWDRVIRALATPAPQEEAKKPCAEITLTAGAWRSLVAGLDEEGAEHETPITVCYDAEHDQGIYCYAEYPDDGARTIDPAPPAREDAKFPAPFEGCDHTAPERVEACWHAQLCPICATKNWHAAQRELKQRRSATPASAPRCDGSGIYGDTSKGEPSIKCERCGLAMNTIRERCKRPACQGRK